MFPNYFSIYESPVSHTAKECTPGSIRPGHPLPQANMFLFLLRRVQRTFLSRVLHCDTQNTFKKVTNYDWYQKTKSLSSV